MYLFHVFLPKAIRVVDRDLVHLARQLRSQVSHLPIEHVELLLGVLECLRIDNFLF